MKNPMKLCLISFILTPLLFSSAWAEDRWFQVEVLIFKNPTIETDNPEIWPRYTDINQPDEYLQLGLMEEADQAASSDHKPYSKVSEISVQSVEELHPFVTLPPTSRQLQQQHNILTSDPNYTVLFHETWNEPVPGRNNVIPIRITGGKQYGRQSELQGFISLYVERYLHFSTDLHLVEYKKSRDPFSLILDDANKSTQALQTLNDFGGLSLINTDSINTNQIARGESNHFYIAEQSAQLQESRRMRSKDIHYLDNPKFGVLILITPIKAQGN